MSQHLPIPNSECDAAPNSVPTARAERPSSSVVALPSPRLAAVENTFRDLLAAVPQLDTPTAAMTIPARMGQAALDVGRIEEAHCWAALGLQHLHEATRPDRISTGALHRLMAEVSLERHNLVLACRHSLQAVDLTAGAAATEQFALSLLCAARCLASSSRRDEAQALLDQARQAVASLPSPDRLRRPLVAGHVATLLSLGEVGRARQWARNIDHDGAHDARFVALQLRVALRSRAVRNPTPPFRSNGHADSTASIGERSFTLLRSLRPDASLRTRVEIGSTSAAALAVEGRIDEAMVILTTTLRIARPETYVRTFTELGPDISTILRDVASHHRQQGDTVMSDYAEEIIDATATPGRETEPHTIVLDDGGESLSDRELQVLRLLSGTLSNREIGAELYVSINTVKTHVKSVYAKLGVNSRSEAVEKGRRLGLIQDAAMSSSAH